MADIAEDCHALRAEREFSSAAGDRTVADRGLSLSDVMRAHSAGDAGSRSGRTRASRSDCRRTHSGRRPEARLTGDQSCASHEGNTPSASSRAGSQMSSSLDTHPANSIHPSGPRYTPRTPGIVPVVTYSKSGAVSATMPFKSPRLNASKARRTISTFSCDIARAVSRAWAWGNEPCPPPPCLSTFPRGLTLGWQRTSSVAPG
jgi:hypothetical protein